MSISLKIATCVLIFVSWRRAGIYEKGDFYENDPQKKSTAFNDYWVYAERL